MKHSACVRHFSRPLTCSNSFIPRKSPVKQVLVLQMRKLGHRKFKSFVQSYRTHKWQSQGLNIESQLQRPHSFENCANVRNVGIRRRINRVSFKDILIHQGSMHKFCKQQSRAELFPLECLLRASPSRPVWGCWVVSLCPELSFPSTYHHSEHSRAIDVTNCFLCVWLPPTRLRLFEVRNNFLYFTLYLHGRCLINTFGLIKCWENVQ